MAAKHFLQGLGIFKGNLAVPVGITHNSKRSEQNFNKDKLKMSNGKLGKMN